MEDRPCRGTHALSASAAGAASVGKGPTGRGATVRAKEALWPTKPIEIVQARLIAWEPCPKVGQPTGIVDPTGRALQHRRSLLHLDG
jgi:hypothetical protein